MTPPRAWDIAPSLLLTSSGTPAATTAGAAQDSGTSLGRDLDWRREANQQRVVRGDYPRPKHPAAWIPAVSPSLLLLTDAGAARPPIARQRTLAPRPERQCAARRL